MAVKAKSEKEAPATDGADSSAETVITTKQQILIICGSLLGLILLLWVLDQLHLVNIAIITDIRNALLAFLEIVALCLLLVMIVTIARWLLRSPEGLAILPFEIIVPDSNDKLRCYNGRSIADSLKAEMVSIADSQSKNPSNETTPGFKPAASEQPDVANKTTGGKRFGNLNIPQFKSIGENLRADFEDMAVVTVSGNSISIGKTMMTLKQMWNDRDPKYIISGSLQRYGNLVRLVCNLKTVGENTRMCEVHKTIKDEEEIPELINELSFKIWQSVPESWQKVISITDAQTWMGLKHFTMSLDSYGRYLSTWLSDHLDEACANCLTAAKDEKGYEQLYPLAYKLGEHLYQLQRYDKAQEMFECAGIVAYDAFPARDGKFVDWATDAHNAYGLCQWNLKQYPNAEYAFHRVIDLKPNLEDGYYNLSRILVNLDRRGEARDVYNKAIELGVIGQDHFFTASGDWLRSLGFPDEALVQYKEAIKKDPKNAGLHYICAKIYIEKQDSDNAIAALNGVWKLEPEYSDASGNPHEDLGFIYLNKGQPETAIGEFGLATHQSPYFALPHFRLGSLYFDRREDEKAIPELEKTIQLDPNFRDAYIFLGLVCDRHGKYEKAVENYNAGLRLDPPNEFLRVCLGGALYNLGQLDDAESEYKEVLKINPDNADAHAGLGYLYRFKEDYPKAIPAFRHAIRLAPDAVSYLLGLTVLYRKSGMWAEAIEVIGDAVRVDTGNALAFLYLAQCQEQQGAPEKAAAAKAQAAALKEAWQARPNWNSKEYWFACYEAMDGQVAQAIDWLRASLQQGSLKVRFVNSAIDLDPLRGEPAFTNLIDAYTPYT